MLRIAHASLTPALRERERALAAEYPDLDLQVLTTNRWHEAGIDVEATDDDLFLVRSARPLFSHHIQLFAYGPRPVIAALRGHRPHLIDLNHEPYSAACAEILTLRDWFAPGVPVVMQVAQNIFRRYPPPFNWLQRRALQRIDAAYVCNETAREVLLSKGFQNPIINIPFGVNTRVFRPQPTRKGVNETLTIGFVGRMLPGKGLHVLADALAEIADLKWKLLLVGDGPERESFEAALARRRLTERAELPGAVAYERVTDFYQRMDVVVMPTRTTNRIKEQFGRVLVEAMASGIPVVGTTSGAIPDVLADAGVIVSEGDPGALAAALRRLLLDAALRHRLATLGRMRVEQNYSWELVARKTYDLFQQVLRAHTSAAVTQPLQAAA